jgi:hypothetical protein
VIQIFSAVIFLQKMIQCIIILQEVPDQQLIFSLQPVSVLRIEFQICQFTDSLCLFPPQIAITENN